MSSAADKVVLAATLATDHRIEGTAHEFEVVLFVEVLSEILRYEVVFEKCSCLTGLLRLVGLFISLFLIR